MRMPGIFSTVLMLGLLYSLSLSATDKVPDAIGIWLFEDEDHVGMDSSGNGQDGEVLGEAELVDAKFGRGIKFNGVDQCIEVPHSEVLSIDGDQVTIMCWFWWEGGGDTWPAIVSKGPMTGTNENWAYFLNTDNKHTHFVICPDGPRPQINSNMNAFGPQEWHFTAATYDGESAKIYMDGEIVTDEAHSGNLIPNDKPLRIGSREECTVCWWKGILDEIAVFRRALSEDEIVAAMQNGLSNCFLAVEPSSTSLSTTWGGIRHSYQRYRARS